jgi:succinate dehydrogenase/fumarate reductase flavoprotein subunit
MVTMQVRTCDVLVIGSGAGGMAAAITARRAGLDVLVVEKEPHFGGSMALSGGWMWVPGNPLAKQAGVSDPPEVIRDYIRGQTGNYYDQDLVDAFIEFGPKMVEFFERETDVKFFLGLDFPDYDPDAPGGRSGGRAICPLPINGRELGKSIANMKPGQRELTFLGVALRASGPDVKHFLNVLRSPASAWYVAKRIGRSFFDNVRYGRDMALVSGAALTVRCMITANRLGIPILLSSPAKELIMRDAEVCGAVIEHEGKRIRVLAKRGVVLATGGFPGNNERRQMLLPHAPSADQHFTLAPSANVGDGLDLGVQAGGTVNRDVFGAAVWMPVSRVPYRDGTFGVYPHVIDRSKPGVIAVRSDGKRFANEAEPYSDFVPALIAGQRPGSDIFAFLVADHKSVRKYGLGFAKPAPMPLFPYLRSGYLMRGNTIEELANHAGIDAAALAATIERVNSDARKGIDAEFGKGSNAHNRFLGDAAQSPNPCLGTLETPPFYALKIYPGDIGTFIGLKTDRYARVLGKNDRAIEGLYAAGNDNAQVFRGAYPGPGATLGPAFTFGYIAGRHLAEKDDQAARSPEAVSAS